MILPTAFNTSGLGYFAAVGFYESSYNSQSNKLYSIKYYGVPNLNKEKFDNDVSKFFSLLKEHLDYLSSNNHILTNGNGQGMSSILISFPVQVKTNDAPIKIY
jgi:hypothetical protein